MSTSNILITLGARGSQDVLICGQPQITFFRSVYKRHSPFAINMVKQYFTGNINFGQKNYCLINNSIGDLMNDMYLRIKLPSLTDFATIDQNGHEVHYYWVNSIGLAIIKEINIQIGEQIIDRQYGLWMNIWSELTIGVDKKYAYNQMIGRDNMPININNENALNLTVPLQFWFCKHIGSSLPTIALQQNEVRVNVEFRRSNELIITSTGVPPNDTSIQNLQIQEAYLDVNFIFLDDPERREIVKQDWLYLIEQTQVWTQTVYNKGIRNDEGPNNNISEPQLDQTINIDKFSNLVKELFWVIQSSTILMEQQWFNFSSLPYSSRNKGIDPITHAAIYLENKDITNEHEAVHFRILQPYMYHSVVPNNFIYLYSFSLKPEEFQPHGHLNFSNIDSVQLKFKLQNNVIDPMVTIYATNYNFLRIRNGMAGLEYYD